MSHAEHPATDPTTPEGRLAKAGYLLPTPTPPVAAYVPTRRVGNLLFVSGQVPFRDGVLLAKGAVPGACSVEQAIEAARQCAINALAAIKAAVRDLGRVKGIVRVGVFVSCDATFTEHSKVANGASELLVLAFGEAGRHARAAVGCPSLPLGASVEVEVACEVV